MPGRLVLGEGEVGVTDAGVVHCAASGCPLVLIWGEQAITLQPVRSSLLGAAIAGHVEATREGDEQAVPAVAVATACARS